jgi:hypothetical protein
MKKLIGFVVILAAAGGGWWYYIKYGKPPEKPTVNYATISRGDIVEAVTSTARSSLCAGSMSAPRSRYRQGDLCGLQLIGEEERSPRGD